MDTLTSDSQNNKPTIILSESTLRNFIIDNWNFISTKKVWGVPRGGHNIALILAELKMATLSLTAEDADVIVDDLVDSGATKRFWLKKFPDKDFWTPIQDPAHWYVFPWEESKTHDAESVVTRLLQLIGENPNREGLLDTPKRVVKSWKELYAGYNIHPEEVLGTVFTSDNDSMVICKDIEFYSMCEHHMLPFFGKAHISYIPKGSVVGLSKLARLVDVFSRRLQIQEQLTDQIADSIVTYINGCTDVMVVVEAKHMCMCSRGVNKQNSMMTTSAVRGAFKTQPEMRNEFLGLFR